MQTVTLVLILLLVVVVSGWVSRALPWPVPRPLVQIALGAMVGLAADVRVALEPEVFFLLFLPPLLFLDGWRIPKEEMLRDAPTILELALGLVVFTVLGMGYFIHWLMPAIPLPVAFALAAILSPTDPIAVSSIAARVPIPKRLMHILEGESLLNDASGLVCFRFAVAAMLTGSFSLGDAALSFLWIALGGIAIGVLVSLVVTRGKIWLARRIGEESGTQILVSLLIPFGSYLLAEHLHCSGILAAVAAGITMSFAEASGPLLANTRLQRSTVWDTIQFAANGIIFVLLGEQLPGILAWASETVRITGHDDPWWLLAYVVAINLALAALRLLWVWVSLNFTLFRANLRGEAMRRPHWRLVVATSVAGVRGAITLAGILTLPLALEDGTPFPARDLAILLAMGVIILSLVVANIGLPLLLRGLEMPAEDSHVEEEDRARIAAAEAAIAAVERAQHALAEGRGDADLYVSAAARIMDFYRSRIDHRSGDGDAVANARRTEAAERLMLLAALKAERGAILAMRRSRRIRSETAHRLMREIDLLELRHDG
ncbi:Na+/H+ antiporter [Roseomonas sp. SSH11]|uniref:Na+/H+ antiporter n=1 Tax=Pararoseomonas baculiformis TaxID=2820812 RepID=A0ABS4A9S8_9PROT|nr:Na+/H+ antiporter [Pararoseomonas baculiformis]MBP0443761.1 Na+/H+ antiporter [Pararoseomonas baculiformis]